MLSTIRAKATNAWQSGNADVHTANFRHLYWDIAWFGLAFGTTLSFLAVFATRLGAEGWQVALLTAGPALINTLFTLPAGRWLESRPLGVSVVTTALCQRIGFFLLIPIPLLLPPSLQLGSVIVLSLLMAIPGTALAIGFNALLAATVPPERRGEVVGRRNALMAAMIMLAFVLSGQVLNRLPFAEGYAVVFGLGALGMAMSTFHLARIRVPPVPAFRGVPINDRAQPGRMIAGADTPPRFGIGLRLGLRHRPSLAALASRISGRFAWVMVAYFLFHATQHLPLPLFPLFWVREAHLDDGSIGILNAGFYLSMLVASPFLARFAQQWGNRRLTVWGAIVLALYPLITAMSNGLGLLLVAAVLGGSTWAILGGAVVNRILEVVPEDDRPGHLAVYNLILNIAILSGTMVGPVLAEFTGLRIALVAACIVRLGAGVALARWG